jgi:3'-phosphoadenosine 5'-phosphosulfate (PAPS) 3'-phosphatase
VAGSGNKIVNLVENKTDYYLNFVPGFKYWDMVASEAIIQSRYGIVTNAEGAPLEYHNGDPLSHKVPSYTLRDGIIIAKNTSILKLAEKRIESEIGMTLGEAQ